MLNSLVWRRCIPLVRGLGVPTPCGARLGSGMTDVAGQSIFDFVETDKLDHIPLENIRNFSVIAHVDHGKSTLSDAVLQYTGNINESERKRGQVMDTLKVERERGITVKAQTASMIFHDKRTETDFLLNLIDTPGHIDFSYEVSRSLASCQGALLLVDSSQSIQAQTLATHEKAKNLGLQIIPVVTKIDLPGAQPEDVALNMASTFDLDPSSVIPTSAKAGIGVLEVLEAVHSHVSDEPVDTGNANGRFCGRIVDSWYDEHRGVVCLIQAVGGSLQEGQRITTYASVKETKDIDTRSDFSVQEIGLLTPQSLRTGVLRTGQVGYVIAGLRSTRQARMGDTMSHDGRNSITPLSGYEAAKPMLFASVFPVNTLELEALFAAVDRLCLNDSSISVQKDQSSSLGAGLRCGFLGFLHMEVFNQRLSDEFGIQIVMTTPSVPYLIESRNTSKEARRLEKLGNDPQSRKIFEPVVKVRLVCPQEYYGPMAELLKQRRCQDLEVHYMDDGKIAVNGDPCDPLSFVCHTNNAQSAGRKMASKLKEVLPRQNFEIVLQAKVGSKVLARERIAPYRKDVLTKGSKTVGGGDITRKKKLLEKQKAGKKRAKMVGKVEIGQDAFWSVLQR
eukprot:GSChrysophyteH1.ASY1.ANO1.1972.1 assembled CDS